MDTPDSVQRPSVGEGRREEGLLELTLVAECERMGALIGDARIPLGVFGIGGIVACGVYDLPRGAGDAEVIAQLDSITRSTIIEAGVGKDVPSTTRQCGEALLIVLHIQQEVPTPLLAPADLIAQLEGMDQALIALGAIARAGLTVRQGVAGIQLMPTRTALELRLIGQVAREAPIGILRLVRGPLEAQLLAVPLTRQMPTQSQEALAPLIAARQMPLQDLHIARLIQSLGGKGILGGLAEAIMSIARIHRDERIIPVLAGEEVKAQKRACLLGLSRRLMMPAVCHPCTLAVEL